MSKTLRITILLLSVSLVMNIALGAFVTTRIVRDHTLSQITQFTESEPSEAMRSAFRQAVSENQSAFLQAARGLYQARDHQHSILTAETLDMAALEQAHGEVRTKMVAFVDVLQRALRNTAATLPDAERRAIPKLGVATVRGLAEDGEQQAE
ncbi:MAG: hypothetical protein AAGL24_28380 [Pseudomonadota bacterium]